MKRTSVLHATTVCHDARVPAVPADGQEGRRAGFAPVLCAGTQIQRFASQMCAPSRKPHLASVPGPSDSRLSVHICDFRGVSARSRSVLHGRACIPGAIGSNFVVVLAPACTGREGAFASVLCAGTQVRKSTRAVMCARPLVARHSSGGIWHLSAPRRAHRGTRLPKRCSLRRVTPLAQAVPGVPLLDDEAGRIEAQDRRPGQAHLRTLLDQ